MYIILSMESTLFDQICRTICLSFTQDLPKDTNPDTVPLSGKKFDSPEKIA